MKIKTKSGLFTPYALACGYSDSYRVNVRGRGLECSMGLDGCYHVKIWHGGIVENVISGSDYNGSIHWASYDTLKDARKGFTLAKRAIRQSEREALKW